MNLSGMIWKLSGKKISPLIFYQGTAINSSAVLSGMLFLSVSLLHL